jgi:hypothetical protein
MELVTRINCLTTLDADRLEADWEHALDVAGEAVAAGRKSKALGPLEAALMARHIRDERRWLHDFSPRMHVMFPSR